MPQGVEHSAFRFATKLSVRGHEYLNAGGHETGDGQPRVYLEVSLLGLAGGVAATSIEEGRDRVWGGTCGDG